MDLAEFNAAPGAEAKELLKACLDIDAWADEVVDGRPYPDRSFLQARGEAAAGLITWAQVAGALARHPRIGEKPAQDSEREQAWSSSEQSGVEAADAASAAALASGNAAYELRFGYLFLICATGLTSAEILAELHRRINNTPEDEQREVMRELREIAALRLAKAVT